MTHDDLFKIDLGGTFLVCLDYHTGGKLLRVSANDKPRDRLYVVAARVLALAYSLYNVPDALSLRFKSASFSSGNDGGTVLVAEGYDNKIKLSFPKIPSKEVTKSHFENGVKVYEVDPDHPRNKFNAELDDLKDEILCYIRGQGQQLSLEFNQMEMTEIVQEGIDLGLLKEKDKEGVTETYDVLKARAKYRGGKRAVAERVIEFPGAQAAQ
jgi:hypothetical protein